MQGFQNKESVMLLGVVARYLNPISSLTGAGSSAAATEKKVLLLHRTLR